MTFSAGLQRLMDGHSLGFDDMALLFGQLMRGEWTPAQIAGFAIALRCKGETVEEVAAAASVMRQLVTPVVLPDGHAAQLVDLCGTGGDGAHTFNISTAAMFVAAGAGAKVAKHGGRSVSSSSGSADVLEACGANIQLKPEQVARCIAQAGVGFMFAPNHHAAMKHAGPVRKELGVRTVFNILGPLTNPAGARRQLMGVFKPDLVGLQARVLQKLGSQHVMVVHGHNGMDEIVLSGPTRVAELKDGHVREYDITPESLGLACQPHDTLGAASAAQSRDKILQALDDQPGAVRDIVLINAAAAIYVGGLAESLPAGLECARQSISSGAARRALDQFCQTTQSLAAANPP
jgi:anthranilate phosphoribosyltransferase